MKAALGVGKAGPTEVLALIRDDLSAFASYPIIRSSLRLNGGPPSSFSPHAPKPSTEEDGGLINTTFEKLVRPQGPGPLSGPHRGALRLRLRRSLHRGQTGRPQGLGLAISRAGEPSPFSNPNPAREGREIFPDAERPRPIRSEQESFLRRTGPWPRSTREGPSMRSEQRRRIG
jgi:hypothetical protein